MIAEASKPTTAMQNRVIERLERHLQREVKPGDLIPAERALADRLGVSRPTVRIGLEALESKGVIRKLGSLGRQLCEPPAHFAPLLTGTICIVSGIPGVPALDQRASGWEIFVQSGAWTAVQTAEFNTLVLSPSRAGMERMRSLVEHGLSGVILCHTTPVEEARGQLVALCNAAGVPVVVYGDESLFPDVDTIYSDHQAGSAALAKWLLLQERKRIARVWSRDPDQPYAPWLEHRDRGYTSAMLEARLTPLPALEVPFRHTQSFDAVDRDISVHAIAGYLLQYQKEHGPVDALMVVSDGEADRVLAACRVIGLSPGQDVMVVGYDNYYAVNPYATGPDVPAATVDKRNPEIGKELASLLIDRINGKLPAEPQHRLVKPQLIVTETPVQL